jgi:hypothetical protein
MSLLDQDLSIECISTIFGLNYNGAPDPGDNGIGAFEDITTGRLYRTANKILVAVSIPIPFYEDTPDMTRAMIVNRTVTCTIEDQFGNFYEGIRIADLGPGKNGKLIRAGDGPHLLDRTYALCKLMQAKGCPMDNVKLRYWLLNDAMPYSIQGQDTAYLTI